jgi:hypothetical protein
MMKGPRSLAAPARTRLATPSGPAQHLLPSWTHRFALADCDVSPAWHSNCSSAEGRTPGRSSDTSTRTSVQRRPPQDAASG